ncbi:MAG: YebC/PmpR family DNA-binding transcriptional regulator [Candidatus Peregrinibacteria bacterium]
MSGHSKWSKIKNVKGANDAVKGKIFTRHAKLITIAAREGGGDPEMNPLLRMAIDHAKADNIPNANVERAIKKGTGEDKDGAQLFEVLYEGYGPGGSAILVNSLTDNKNRALTSIRTIFNKNGGHLGESGSVAFMFERKGIIRIPCDSPSKAEEQALLAIDAGADDFIFEDEELEIITPPESTMAVKEVLVQNGITPESVEVTMRAKNHIEICDIEMAQKIMHIIDLLEDDEDVSAVHSNVNIAKSVLEAMEA